MTEIDELIGAVETVRQLQIAVSKHDRLMEELVNQVKQLSEDQETILQFLQATGKIQK